MIVRSYIIPVYSNPGKQESIRYTATRFVQFVQHFVNKFFYDQVSKSSSRGMGQLANEAQLSKRNSLSLAVENPKSLSNLKPKGLSLWAKCYFANRATIRAREEGIHIVYVNPAYSSQTCSKCGVIDRWSRVKQAFRCTACGYVAHADLNAACILAQRASVGDH